MRLAETLRKLGKNIQAARQEAGLRQIDVSEKTGLTYRHYQNIEAGRVNVTFGTLCRLAHLFGLPLARLVDACH